MNISGVEYKEIPGLHNYYVGYDGSIYSSKRNKTLKLSADSSGYLQFYPTDEHGKKRTALVHRAVALVWLDNPDNKPEVHHKDENRKNNAVDNLAWVTHKENTNVGNHNANISKTLGKPIVLTSIADGSKMYFNSTRAARRAGYNPDAVLAGITKQVKGYTAEYVKK